MKARSRASQLSEWKSENTRHTTGSAFTMSPTFLVCFRSGVKWFRSRVVPVPISCSNQRISVIPTSCSSSSVPTPLSRCYEPHIHPIWGVNWGSRTKRRTPGGLIPGVLWWRWGRVELLAARSSPFIAVHHSAAFRRFHHPWSRRCPSCVVGVGVSRAAVDNRAHVEGKSGAAS